MLLQPRTVSRINLISIVVRMRSVAFPSASVASAGAPQYASSIPMARKSVLPAAIAAGPKYNWFQIDWKDWRYQPTQAELARLTFQRGEDGSIAVNPLGREAAPSDEIDFDYLLKAEFLDETADQRARSIGPKWVSVMIATRRPSSPLPSLAIVTSTCLVRGSRIASA